MKIFIKNIIYFSLSLILVYPILILFTGRCVPQLFKPNINYHFGTQGYMFTRIKELKNLSKNIDVLFLGSSHAYRGFDPRNFKNKNVFNLGSSIQSPMQTHVLLNRYLDKINPQTIIYEVYPATFTVDGVESSLNLIACDKNDQYSLQMAFAANNVKTYNTLVYGYFVDAFHFYKKFEEPGNIGDDTYIPGGYVERKISYYKHQIIPPKNKWNFNIKQIKKFEENISLIKNKNINLVLVCAPFTKSLYNSYTNNNYFDSLMKSYNLPYYNFNNTMQLDDSLDFYDASHLNQNGVNKFNQKLKETLPEIFSTNRYEN